MLVATLLVTLVGIVVWKASIPHEPTYNGRKLSELLDELIQLPHTKFDSNVSQVQVVRAVGTNAIPWLLHQFQPSSSTWRRKVNQLLNKQAVVHFRFADTDQRLRRAAVGFWALGEMGESAIPALLNLEEVYPYEVRVALTGLGPSAIPALQRCLAKTRFYTNSAGVSVDLAGDAIGRINYAAKIGVFPKAGLLLLLTTMEGWVQQSTNQYARREAEYFIENVSEGQ
jgi:hypothetical protein